MPCLMWIILVQMFTLYVLINYTQCEIDPCFLNGSDIEIKLCLRLWKNTEELSFNSTENVSIGFVYNEGDTFKLACISKAPIVGKSEIVRWKLKQNKNELLATKYITIHNLRKRYDIIITLDRTDHNLVAICEASGTKNIIEVWFSWNSINRRPDAGIYENKREDKYYTIGQPVPNTLDRQVIVYNKYLGIEKYVKPKSNIYDGLTKDINEIHYSAWFEGNYMEGDLGSTTNLTVYKKYTKIIVFFTYEPRDSFPTAAVVAVIVSLFVIAVLAFWIYRKYVKRRQVCDNNAEHIYSEAMQVTYAQINLKASDRPLPPPPQEPYATIIGVVKPKKTSTTRGETRPEDNTGQ